MLIMLIILLPQNSSVSCCMDFGGGCGCWADFGAVLEGMLQLDTNIKDSPPTLSNISVPANIEPGMNGAMIHVPVGDQGVLILI